MIRHETLCENSESSSNGNKQKEPCLYYLFVMHIAKSMLCGTLYSSFAAALQIN